MRLLLVDDDVIRRAAEIAHAIDEDVRGRVVDSFCDLFLTYDRNFDVAAFEALCAGKGKPKAVARSKR